MYRFVDLLPHFFQLFLNYNGNPDHSDLVVEEFCNKIEVTYFSTVNEINESKYRTCFITMETSRNFLRTQ